MADARQTRSMGVTVAAHYLMEKANAVIDALERMRDFAMERNIELFREIKRDRDRFYDNWCVIECRNEQINTCGTDRRRLNYLLERLETPTATEVNEIREEIDKFCEKYEC